MIVNNNFAKIIIKGDVGRLNKERLTAFTDAVLAIIMTILVLELEKPKEVTWEGLWDLRMNFFAYAVSFFWLGLMWADNHRAFQKISKISNATVAWTLIMLFFASLFPYSTSIVSSDFNNSTAQVFYGIIIILVSFSNIGISRSLNKAGNKHRFKALFDMTTGLVVTDLGIKVLGIILSLTIFAPATIWSIFIASAMLIIWSSYQSKSFQYKKGTLKNFFRALFCMVQLNKYIFGVENCADKITPFVQYCNCRSWINCK